MKKTLFLSMSLTILAASSYGMTLTDVITEVAVSTKAAEGKDAQIITGKYYSYDQATGKLTPSHSSIYSNLTFDLNLNWDLTSAADLIYVNCTDGTDWGMALTGKNQMTQRWLDGYPGGTWTGNSTIPSSTVLNGIVTGATSAKFTAKINNDGTFLKHANSTTWDIYENTGLKSSTATLSEVYINKDYIATLYLNDVTGTKYTNSDGTWSATYSLADVINVTVGQVQVDGGETNTIGGVAVEQSDDIIVGGNGSLFLQTWHTSDLNLSNTIYLGDSSNTGARGGSIHFGNDDDTNPLATTTLSGAIYLVEDATLKARGTNTINITGTVTDKNVPGSTTVTDKNVPGSTDADSGYKLTLAGKGYNFTETSDVNVTTLEFAAAQKIHDTENVTTSATFKNGFSAENLIMNVGNEITSEKAISGLTSLEVLGGGKATLAADLDLTSLSTLKLDSTLNLSGNKLTLGNAITFSGGKLNALKEIDDFATIFEGVSVFNGVARSAETVIFDASKYFANLPTENQYVLSYANGNVAIKLIPEPTTATLSLLALAGLAARRRRR